MLSLHQRLSQQQKLSPQQIQYQKLLQLNTLALEQRIKTELELNPILEEELEMTQEDKEKEKDEDWAKIWLITYHGQLVILIRKNLKLKTI